MFQMWGGVPARFIRVLTAEEIAAIPGTVGDIGALARGYYFCRGVCLCSPHVLAIFIISCVGDFWFILVGCSRVLF